MSRVPRNVGDPLWETKIELYFLVNNQKLENMPEGPECRLTVDFLNEALASEVVTNWIFSGGKYTDEYPDGYETFDEALPLVLREVSCKGKFIYFTFIDNDSKEYYVLHSLMMTGRWQKNHDDFCKWFLETEGGRTIWFRDPRAFATLSFTDDPDVLQAKLDSLGPDIMRPEFKLPLFKSLAVKYDNRNVTSFVMDQAVISGCGNYIKAEALYEAKISPLRKIAELSEAELESLYHALRIIPRVSYNNKGVSLRDYADENGKDGYYGRDLKVYSKKGARKTSTADGRTTYWDPNRQI